MTMGIRKKINQYHFVVEGQTEELYLKWLQDEINKVDGLSYNVSIICKVERNLTKFAKKLKIVDATDIYCLFDFESSEAEYVKKFTSLMDNMKEAEKMGKQIECKLAYTNLTFDLWIILHKIECNCSIFSRKLYIKYLNDAYNEKFNSMDQYKVENNFKRVLKKLSILDVINAISRAENIMQKNTQNKLQEYKGYEYYKENPSLMTWEPIKKILDECGVHKFI